MNITAAKRPRIHPEPFRPPEWAERWRVLLPEQRAAVLAALTREGDRLMRHARAARRKADGAPEPYSKHHAGRARTHSSSAGACRIAVGLLESLGGYP